MGLLSEPEIITVEIACALPQQQFFKRYAIPAGSTLDQAIALSEIDNYIPAAERTTLKTGIHGRIVSQDVILQPDDRIEFYRPLLIDPKEKRRLRSARRKK